MSSIETSDEAAPSSASEVENGSWSFGRRTMLAGAAGTAIGAAVSPLLSSSASASTPLSVFESITPSLRLADTRAGTGSSRVDGSTIRVAVAGRTELGVTIPADAVAAVFTVVGINRRSGRAFLTTYPSLTARPVTSSLNMNGLNDVANNLVTVKLGTDGAAEFYTSDVADVVVDLVGVYRPAGGATRPGRFEPLGGLRGGGPAAKRIYSPEVNGTPRSGETVRVDVTGLINQGLIEESAQAVIANLTVARPSERGFASAYPFGESIPETSSLNFVPNSIRAANSIVRIGTDPATGRKGFNIFITNGTRLYVDVTGYFTGEGAEFDTTTGQFIAVNPRRILDTRANSASMRGVGAGKRLWAGWTRRFALPADVQAAAGAVAVNLTLANSLSHGWLTLSPARTPRENVSTLNASAPAQVAANHAVLPISSEGLEVFSSGGGSVICDLVGYYKGVGVSPWVPAVADPPPPPIAAPYVLGVPRIGRTMSVVAGASSAATVDTGRIWHWTGTGIVGQGAPIGTFGHRTDAGGPFRNVHWLGPGDLVTLDTADQRRYTYEYLDRELTDERDENILEAAFRQSGEVLSLIACTVGFDSSKSAFPDAWAPTSLRFRIVVRLRLRGWEDTSPLQ